MTLSELQDLALFQAGNDEDDLQEFLPELPLYINDAYDRLVYAWDQKHVNDEEYPKLALYDDVPNLPEWTHKAIADWATWCLYRNGNAIRQQRGYAFRAAFDEVLNKITSEGGKKGKVRNFFNIPN